MVQQERSRFQRSLDPAVLEAGSFLFQAHDPVRFSPDIAGKLKSRLFIKPRCSLIARAYRQPDPLCTGGKQLFAGQIQRRLSDALPLEPAVDDKGGNGELVDLRVDPHADIPADFAVPANQPDSRLSQGR